MAVLGDLKEKIIKAKLTRKESEIAEYILNNVSKACFMSASDLAKELDTSNTSVNRAAKALGYNVFGDLQQELQQYISYQADQSDKYMLPPKQRIENAASGNSDEEDLIKRQYELVSSNLMSVLSKNSTEKIDSVVKLLAECKFRYINGNRGTADMANKLAFLLRLIVGNVIVTTQDDVVAMETVMDIGPEDCIVVFSFNRYNKNTLYVIDACKKKNAKVILITDRATAPCAQYADELLTVDVTSLSYFNSNVSTLFLLELICTKLALRIGDSARERLNALEPYINRTQLC